MKQHTIDLHVPPKYVHRAIAFADNYDLTNAFYLPEESNKGQLRNYKERKCRFCGTNLQSKFKRGKNPTIAHLVPKTLGNNTWFSDFECIDCNQKFGKFEDDLGKFFNVGKALSPQFNSVSFKDAEKEIRNDSILGKGIKSISNLGQEGTPVELGLDGERIVRIKTPAFRPFKVYFSFLKMALSIMDEEQCAEYSTLSKLLLEKRFVTLKNIWGSVYHLPFGSEMATSFFLFARKTGKNNFDMARHVFGLTFLDKQIFVPVIGHDENVGVNKNIQTLKPPPLLHYSKGSTERINVESFDLDISSNDFVSIKTELRFTAPDNARPVKLNPITGEWSYADAPPHPDSVRKIILTNENLTELDEDKRV